jgi:hypothetical protein
MLRTLRMRIQSESGVLVGGGSPLRIQLLSKLSIESNQLLNQLHPTPELDKRKQKKSILLAHSLVASLLFRLPLQIPIKLRKPRPSLLERSKPRKSPRHDTTKLLTVSESRPARRDSTGLEAEEMVAVEEEGYASTPFELGGCVFLLLIAPLVDVSSDEG